MEEKIKVIEYNLTILKMRIEKLELLNRCDYQVVNCINKMNEKLFEIADLLESIELITEDYKI